MLSVLFEMPLQHPKFGKVASPLVFSFFHPFKLSLQWLSHSGSWMPLERHKPMEEGSVCVELQGVCGTCHVPAEAVPRYNLPGVWRKHSLLCTSNCSHCGDSPEDEHLDKYNPAQQVWAERNQVFFRLHGRSGSSSFGLRHLRPTATPVPALVDPDPPLNPIWIYCWSPRG